jgi:hypothetical protein
VVRTERQVSRSAGLTMGLPNFVVDRSSRMEICSELAGLIRSGFWLPSSTAR